MTDALVVVAMSGGVDSSVAAGLAAGCGGRVIGVTLRLRQGGATSGGCCGGDDVADAVAVAARLGIAHYVIDATEVFTREVVGEFAASYRAGLTPVPCVACNETVKFRDLARVARDLGAQALITGHYARIESAADGPALLRGREIARDQSYFLHSMTREQLGFVRFPLGDMMKADVRARAAALGLSVAGKPDSQDICFVPDGDYRAVLARDGADEPQGEIVHVDGTAVGRHAGLSAYTVGQRRGLGVGGRRDPLYVVRLETAANRVIVGPRAALAVDALTLSRLNWIGPARPEGGRRVEVKVRSTARAVTAWISGNGARVVFDEPEYAVAPGQSCVLYDGDRVLGGGPILATEASLSRAWPATLPAI